MPAHHDILGDTKVKLLAAYVLSLGKEHDDDDHDHEEHDYHAAAR
jgi:hypothetical protein